jgi:hypothetical protein
MSPQHALTLIALLISAISLADETTTLEDNYRVYKVEDGKRTMFKGEKIPGDEKWHTLRVTMVGPKITCYFDGKRYLDAEDATFRGAGMVGLWSKADAQS